MVEFLCIICVLLGFSPLAARTRTSLLGVIGLYVVAAPVLLVLFIEAIRSTQTTSYGEHMSLGVIAVLSAVASAVLFVITAVYTLVRTNRSPVQRG